MRFPVSEKMLRDLKVERTGDIAMTRPKHCYECGERVTGGPDMALHFDDIDTNIAAWVCERCWKKTLSDDERDSLGIGSI